MNNTTPLESLKGYIWFNGNFIEWQDAKIHMLTHSLHYSGSVFEGIKAVNGKIFRARDHFNRLLHSALKFNLKIDYTNDEMINATKQLLLKNDLTDCYIRPLVWRSTETLMVMPKLPKTNIMIAAWKPAPKNNNIPLKLNISDVIKPTEKMHPVQCKASSQYAIYSNIVTDAIEKGFNDSIMLDIDNNISECTTSNIFFVTSGEIHMPTTKYSLSGITRKTILEILTKNNIKFSERDIKVDEIQNFQSAFITGTASGVREVKSIDCRTHAVEFRDNNLVSFLKENYNKILGE